MNEITEEIKQMYREYKLDIPIEYITGYDVRDSYLFYTRVRLFVIRRKIHWREILAKTKSLGAIPEKQH